MNDVDLLFAQDKIETAEQVLTELGYGAKHKDPNTGPGITKHTSTYLKSGKRGATPNPYLSPDAERMIEPHTSLEESWFGLKTDITPGVHERAVQTSLAGVSCRTLSPEDLLLHLSVHFCYHFIMGAPVMVQLLDLLHVTQKLNVDYNLLALRAGDTQSTPFLFAALHLAQKLLAAPCPEPFLTKLSRQIPTGLQTYIQNIDLALLLARTQQQPLNNLSQRIRRGLSDRAAAARWAIGLPKKLSVWGTTFVFWKTDTGLLLTGRPLKT
jgi:hypothetical protein